MFPYEWFNPPEVPVHETEDPTDAQPVGTGEKMSVTSPTASDALVFFIDWLSQGGVPNIAGLSINERTMSIGMTFEL